MNANFHLHSAKQRTQDAHIIPPQQRATAGGHGVRVRVMLGALLGGASTCSSHDQRATLAHRLNATRPLTFIRPLVNSIRPLMYSIRTQMTLPNLASAPTGPSSEEAT